MQLRLVKCWTPPQVLTEMLERIDEDAIYLRSLGLIDMGVREHQLEIIASIMNRNDNLQNLDLSWNGLIAKDVKQFLKVIATNQNLVSLNLSWN
jgi:PP-loop superfamily ATP-utilizing enzyme